MTEDTREKFGRPALSDAERQAKHRAQMKEQAQGTMKICLLDQAKAELRSMNPPDLLALLEKPLFKDQLTNEDLKKLKVFS